MNAVQADAADRSAIVTVVIVNYNGAHLLPPCLDALDAQRIDAPPFETMVVDNASSDSSLELLRDRYPWVRVIASSVNTGFAGGNNLALRQVTTKYVALLNNDAIPQPGWLRNLLAPFASGNPLLGMVTGKVVFLPRFVSVELATEGFRPGPHDTRDLGVRIRQVSVDGVDVTAKVLWESAAYGLEHAASESFHWTKPTGTILVPVPLERTEGQQLGEDVHLTLTVAAERDKKLTVNGTGHDVDERYGTVQVLCPSGSPAVDVINNAGGIVLTEGYGADRGFQQPDVGQYDRAEEVFVGCGNGMALPTRIGRKLGWFDDSFFMYYEDTDLSWRLRATGYSVRYEPSAVLRHVHAASSKEWSPRWVYYVERNRLLMLTKDAPARLALRTVLRYPATTASMALRAMIEGARTRQRPALRPHLLRLRIIAGYLRLLPKMLAERHQQTISASLPRDHLAQWLTERR